MIIRNLILVHALIASAGGMYARTAPEETDSLNRQLNEIVVQARTQRVVKYGVEYIPGKKVKKSAIDATRLLQQMQIPQLSITPGSAKVTTVSGQDVAMFIDYIPASEQDLQGLRPEDVLRVEVLDYPEDPRFNGADYVVNFIMQHYEWGGYTKLTATGATVGIDRVKGDVYSKFVYKKWTFDVSAGGMGLRNDEYRSHGEELYRDFNLNGRHVDELARLSDSGADYLSKSDAEWVTLRAAYQTDSMLIQHTASFYRSAMPLNRYGSTVEFSGGILPSAAAYTSETTQSLTPKIGGRYSFTLPKGNSVVASWNFSHSGMRRRSLYRLDGTPEIVNNNRELSYAPEAKITYAKRFRHSNTLRASLMTFNTLYHTEYAGSYAGLQKLLSSENMLFVEYFQNWQCGLNLFSRIGSSYVVGRTNGVTTLKQWNPRAGVQLSYRINGKHSASIQGWYGNNTPSPSTVSTALVRSNELLWLQGNPDLRNTRFAQTNASYTFIPTNAFSLTAGLAYSIDNGKQAYEYFSLPGYDGLIRRSVNSGNCHIYGVRLSATFKFFDNSLSIRVNGAANRAVLTGIDARAASWLSGGVQAAYYLKNFSLTAFYNTPDKQLSGWTDGRLFSYKSEYGIYATYAVGDFKASLEYRNWFSKGRIYEDFSSRRYSTDSWFWNEQVARGLTLTVSYTLPYGKKVNRNNELGVSGASGSAILK